MLMHGFHTRHIFDCDFQCLPLPFVGNNAGQIDLAVADDNIDVDGLRRLPVDLREYTLSHRLIIPFR